MRIDMRTDMRIAGGVIRHRLRMDMFADPCIDMYMYGRAYGQWQEKCVDMRADMCTYMCMDMRIGGLEIARWIAQELVLKRP